MHRGCDVTRVFTNTCGQLLVPLGRPNGCAEVLVEKKVKG